MIVVLSLVLIALAVGAPLLAAYTAHVICEDIRGQHDKQVAELKQQIETCRSQLAADIARIERRLGGAD